MTTSLAADDTRLPYESMRRLIGRLSAGRQWNPSGGYGGKAELTWEDISRAIGRIKRVDQRGNLVPDILAQAMLGYHWGGVSEDKPVLVRELTRHLAVLAAREGWRKRAPGGGVPAKARERADWLQGMANMALSEIVRRKACLTCSAQGSEWRPGGYQTQCWVDEQGVDRIGRIWIKGHWETCEACRGLGVHPWSKRERAICMGVHPSTWNQAWDDRYLDLLAFIDRVELRGLRKLRRVMG